MVSNTVPYNNILVTDILYSTTGFNRLSSCHTIEGDSDQLGTPEQRTRPPTESINRPME